MIISAVPINRIFQINYPWKGWLQHQERGRQWPRRPAHRWGRRAWSPSCPGPSPRSCAQSWSSPREARSGPQYRKRQLAATQHCRHQDPQLCRQSGEDESPLCRVWCWLEDWIEWSPSYQHDHCCSWFCQMKKKGSVENSIHVKLYEETQFVRITYWPGFHETVLKSYPPSHRISHHDKPLF